MVIVLLIAGSIGRPLRKEQKVKKRMALSELVKLMNKCQDDTLAILGSGAAGRLANWQKYEFDQDRLIQFIKDRLRNESRGNGRRLELAGRLSLERIVVHHCPELFDADDIEWAKATLSGL